MTPGSPSLSPENTRIACGQRAAEEQPAKLSRAREARRDRAGSGRDLGRRIAREHAHRDRVVLVDVAAADELAVAGQQLDHGPGRLGHAARAQRVAKHPWMTCPHPGRDVGGNAVLPYACPDTRGAGGRVSPHGAAP